MEATFRLLPLVDPNFHTPYSQNWNFGIEREITDSLQVEVNYVGVRGLRLFRYMDGNAPLPGRVKALEAYCKQTDPALNPEGYLRLPTNQPLPVTPFILVGI